MPTQEGGFTNLETQTGGKADAYIAYLDAQAQKDKSVNKKSGFLKGVKQFFDGWSTGRKKSKEDAAAVMKEFYDK